MEVFSKIVGDLQVFAGDFCNVATAIVLCGANCSIVMCNRCNVIAVVGVAEPAVYSVLFCIVAENVAGKVVCKVFVVTAYSALPQSCYAVIGR